VEVAMAMTVSTTMTVPLKEMVVATTLMEISLAVTTLAVTAVIEMMMLTDVLAVALPFPIATPTRLLLPNLWVKF
jgi:hypothetical protein